MLEFFNAVIDFVYSIMPYAMMTMAPILLAALGGLVSERSGIVNIALEGIMVMGAFIAAIYLHFVYLSSSSANYVHVWIALILSALAGMIFSALHAYASISLSANQVISGTALNMLAPALTIFLAKKITGSQNITIIQGVKRITYDKLVEIPVVGGLFFDKAFLTTFIVLIILIILWYILFKTSFGLRIRACGENPSAADSMGINVIKMRYIGVLTSGLLAGLGGGVYTLTITNEFNGTVVGYGFLGLAALIFGKWKPFNILGTAFFFAFAKMLATVAPVNQSLKSLGLPIELYNAIPYVVTIIALVIFANNTVGPKAAGEIYDKGKR